MQFDIVYIIIAACLIAALIYFRRSGPQRWGMMAGIVMAAIVAAFSQQLVMLPNSMSQTAFLFIAITIGIVMLSILVNKMAAFVSLRMQAAKQEEMGDAAQEELPEQVEPDDLDEDYGLGAEGVIDIQAERLRRANKAPDHNEEYFYEQSQPLEAEREEDSAYTVDDVLDDEWMLKLECERKAAVDTQVIIEHQKQVAEAMAISGEANLPSAVVAMSFKHAHESEGAVIGQSVNSARKDEIAAELTDDPIDILDSAWSHRDAGEWEQSLEAYAQFCSLVDDDRLRLEVEIEALSTMMSAKEYEQATDKVFEILSYEAELSENEKQQITQILIKMQAI